MSTVADYQKPKWIVLLRKSVHEDVHLGSSCRTVKNDLIYIMQVDIKCIIQFYGESVWILSCLYLEKVTIFMDNSLHKVRRNRTLRFFNTKRTSHWTEAVCTSVLLLLCCVKIPQPKQFQGHRVFISHSLRYSISW